MSRFPVCYLGWRAENHLIFYLQPSKLADNAKGVNINGCYFSGGGVCKSSIEINDVRAEGIYMTGCNFHRVDGYAV